jgi:hypothetical protein
MISVQIAGEVAQLPELDAKTRARKGIVIHGLVVQAAPEAILRGEICGSPANVSGDENVHQRIKPR